MNSYVVKDESVIMIFDSRKTVYDKIFHKEISKYRWFYHEPTGYVIHSAGKLFNENYPDNTLHWIYLHSFILKTLSRTENPNNYTTIHHKNWIKLDNRLDNLIWANMSLQNSERCTRKDKLKPCDELIQQGIYTLPKFVRWDKTELKFIIEKHPELLKRVDQGLLKKPIMSATKSSRFSIYEKYQDVVQKLHDLHKQYYDYTVYEKDLEYKNNSMKSFNKLTGSVVDYEYDIM